MGAQTSYGSNPSVSQPYLTKKARACSSCTVTLKCAHTRRNMCSVQRPGGTYCPLACARCSLLRNSCRHTPASISSAARLPMHIAIADEITGY